MKAEDVIEVTESSGNVFADLGLPDADELYAKSMLSILIARTIRDRGLTQTDAARLRGTTQPKISELFRGRLSGFSLERLFRFLNALGKSVRIQVSERESHPAPQTHGWNSCSYCAWCFDLQAPADFPAGASCYASERNS
jgi:predicted XRE-type DNA-binding protein